jgi:hypothetical protein
VSVGTIGDISTTTDIVVIECAICHMVFGMSNGFVAARRKDHQTFYCPNKCSNYYPEQTAEERLRKDLESERDEAAHTRRTLAAERKQHAATKGKVTKLKKRAQHGVCAMCTRTFSNYQRHMEQQHPEALKR